MIRTKDGKATSEVNDMKNNEKNKQPEAPNEAADKITENTDPYQIDFLPEFREGRGPQEPFVNEYGVVIGDRKYSSENSPLNQWSTDTDPAIMSGDQWVHPFNDIGFETAENRDYFEKGIPPKGGRFMHPTKDVSYKKDMDVYRDIVGEEEK